MHAIWTLLLVIVFIGIVVWAWSGRRKRRFEAAARLPLEDDRPEARGGTDSKRFKHGEDPHG